MSSMASLQREYWLENVDLWGPHKVQGSVDVLIEGGIVKEILKSESSSPARFCLIPSGVDAQVHLRVPGQEHKEDADTGLQAALCGGYGAILNMPNTLPVVDSPEVLKMAIDRVEEASRRYGVKVLFSSAVTKGLQGKDLVDFRAMAEAGAAAFTDDGLGVESDEKMEEALRQLAVLQRPFLQHAEFLGHGGVLAPGPVQKKLGLTPYPAEAENKMLERDLRLLEKHPQAKYHLLHATSKEAVDLIQSAKNKKLNVSAEVSPHHLFFNSEDIREDNTAFKMNPPIRQKEDQMALQKALFSGEFDFVATDHAPHAPDEKGEDFKKSNFGTIGLETSLPVLLHFYQTKALSAERLVQVFSTKPARFLGLDSTWGEIKLGQTLRAVVVDPKAAKKAFSESQIHSRSKNSCFLGKALPDAIYGHFTEAGYFSFKEGFKASFKENEISVKSL